MSVDSTRNQYLGYVRVSTNGQADGYGLDIQQSTIIDYVGKTRGGLLRMFEDKGVSGRITDRPGLGDLLRFINPGDVVIVPRLDRLARDLISQELLLAEIRRRGGTLVSCAEGEQAYLDDTEDDPSRKLIRQVLGAVSEYERAMVALRLRAGRRAKREAGGFAGGSPPWGYRYSRLGGIEIEPREQNVLKYIHAGRAQGWTYEQIANALNELGAAMGPRGKRPWNRAAVHHIARHAPKGT